MSEASERYHEDVWGDLPAEYPKETSQRVYRGLLDTIEDRPRPIKLMGLGFKGVAYRFRTAHQCHIDYGELIAPHGVAPGVEIEYQQERALFGFFTSGLASIECFAFALYSLGACLSESDFAVDDNALKGVSPERVTRLYSRLWPDSAISYQLELLAKDERYRRWKRIRNIVSHRASPPRHISVAVGSHTEAIWAVEEVGTGDADQQMEHLTTNWWVWLATQTDQLWQTLDSSRELLTGG